MYEDVFIVIEREIARITRQGFGKPLIFDPDVNADYADCRNLVDVVGAGFGATTDVYKMATAIFRQNPSPPQIAVYGSYVDPTGEAPTVLLESSTGLASITITADPDTLETNDQYNGVKVTMTDSGSGGLDVSYNVGDKEVTIDFGGLTEATADTIATAISTLPRFTGSTATAAATFEADADAGVQVIMSGGYDDRPGGIEVKLAELIATDNDWYFLLSPERTLESVRALSNVAGGYKKIYFGAPDCSVSQIINKSKALMSNRTALWYHSLSGTANDPWLDAAVVGRCAPTNPGSITWKFKQLMGVPVSEVTTTDINNLHAANVNTYISKLGVAQTSEGFTTQGEYIDIARSADWIEARMSERVHYLLFTMPKVPYDNRGFGLIKGEVEAVLQWATTRGIVAVDDDGNGMFSVTVPDRSETDPVDRANRVLRDVRFEFDLAGAIHQVHIHGIIRI